jgi:dethiobiotin synthetase
VSVLVVTGTGTGVGKTIVSAALAANAQARGQRVIYVKVTQTGVPGDVPDVDTVARLTGARTYEGARFAPPLSPEAAARAESRPYADLGALATDVARLDDTNDLVVVEGAGGLLVRYDDSGRTLADLALALAAPVLVVATASLGTLNATALTCEALARRRLRLAGVVVGAWPERPDLAATSNLHDLPVVAGRPLSGALPEGCGALDPDTFAAVAARHLANRGDTAWTS